MRRIWSNAISIILSIILIISFPLVAFASTTVDSIKIDGKPTEKEWGKENAIPITETNSIEGISFSKAYLIIDKLNSRVYIGLIIAEIDETSGNSAVKLMIGTDYCLKIYKNGTKTEPESKSYVLELQSSETTSQQYMFETIIEYPNLENDTPIRISIINSNNKESKVFLLDTKSMTAIEQNTTIPQTTKNENTTTKKIQITTTQKNTKQTQNVQGQKETSYNISTTASKDTSKTKTAISATEKDFSVSSDSSELTLSEQDVPLANIEDVQKDLFSSKSSQGKTKKIAITAVAITLIVVAAVLPVMKNMKSKKENSSNKKTEE